MAHTQTILPLPDRPGTTWDHQYNNGHSWCGRCGKGYNHHGAPADVAEKLNVPENERHLICPPTDAAMEKWRDSMRRQNLDDFVAHWTNELHKLSPTERAIALVRIMRAVDNLIEL